MSKTTDDTLETLDDAPSDEAARAKSLARLVDRLLDGEAPPPALEADERALLFTATAISASLGRPALGVDRRERVMDRVFADGNPLASSRSPSHDHDLTPRSRRLLPWVVAAVASAAAVFLALRGPAPAAPATLRRDVVIARGSSDRLVGKIARAKAADARQRIDTIYAERLATYRTQRLGRFKLGDRK